ncbi:putative type VI secretion system effector [uncultured Aquabacterium sp.]|uniref:putative type VI secretion system effector n=1 Tax=uncultured Aquabacterium sp. TaxID=158753 RepID=UPI0030D2E40F|tara:strand:+ start:314 stop:1048 length:735 start_codon:yes stop_codon:yes gene_type:complete
MTNFQKQPNADGLVKLTGTVRKLKVTRASASFVFTESDQTRMGVVAFAAAIAGLGGEAMATVSNASAMEEEADYLEFELDGRAIKGWVWRNPFKEGDEVSVAAEHRPDGHWEAFGVKRPADKTLALYPHCSRGRVRHFKSAAWWWFFGWGTANLIIMMLGYALFAGFTSPFDLDFWLLFGGLMVFYALMTFSLSRKWMPFVRLAEKVFRALELPAPSNVDLVKSSNKQRTANDPGEFGTFYFRY